MTSAVPEFDSPCCCDCSCCMGLADAAAAAAALSAWAAAAVAGGTGGRPAARMLMSLSFFSSSRLFRQAAFGFRFLSVNNF